MEHLESDYQRKAVDDFIVEYADLFSKGKKDLGRVRMTCHTIELENSRPFKQAPRRLGLTGEDACEKAVDDMLAAGVCEPCQSPWASRVVLVTKKDGTIRFCVDYRQLNTNTIKDSWPIPHIQDCFDKLAGSRWFSTVDMASGYWQVELDPADKDKTAFVTARGIFRFTVMPFGLCNAPATFCRLMSSVMQDLPWNIALAYLDDVIILGKSFDGMLAKKIGSC